MLAAFLPPYPFRGTPAPYLWCYYRLLKLWADEPAFFITGRDYVRPVNDWAGRWECTADGQARLGYTLPNSPQPAQYQYAWLDDARFNNWLERAEGNPLAVFQHFLTKRDADYEQELRQLLVEAPEPLTAVVTFCNVPSLAAVCAELGIALLHMELGPMRGHVYRDTAYLDFSGVNGNTESAARFERFIAEQGDNWQPDLSRQDLLQFFFKDGVLTAEDSLSAECFLPAADESTRHGKDEAEAYLGVALQVEDDSNLIAFANGMNSRSLLTRAQYLAEQQQQALLVRPHPGSMFSLRPGFFQLDDSSDSLTFVRRCQGLITINSSVALEGLLLNKPTMVLGDTSLNMVVAAKDSPEQLRRLVFYLFAYLVPFTLQLRPDYLRFRLAQPNERAIINYHLGEYMTQQSLTLPEISSLSVAEGVTVAVLLANQQQTYQAERAALQETLTELRQQLQAQQQQLAEQQQQLQAQHQQLAAQQYQLTTRQDELLANKQEYQQQQQAWLQERAALLQSSSWRLTQPLRTVRGWFRANDKNIS